MQTPDLTPAQIIAITQAVLAVVVAFGGPLSSHQADAVINLSQVVAVSLLGSDAIIRHGRSRGRSK